MTKTQASETATQMLHRLCDDSPECRPNRWGGWDFGGADAVRITIEGCVNVYKFTDWKTGVLEWQARFDPETPANVIAATIAEALY